MDGRCPEHDERVELVSAKNWFFRLSRYADQIRSAIESGRLRINPAPKRNEVLRLLDQGLHDISVSRPSSRAGGWGIPVPGDPSQVVYVWWDALTNYVTALDYGSSAAGRSPDYRTWWDGPGERVHVIGKGITRFHALYWTGLLLSAGQPLPTTIHVHDYLNIAGPSCRSPPATASIRLRWSMTSGSTHSAGGSPVTCHYSATPHHGVRA